MVNSSLFCVGRGKAATLAAVHGCSDHEHRITERPDHKEPTEEFGSTMQRFVDTPLASTSKLANPLLPRPEKKTIFDCMFFFQKNKEKYALTATQTKPWRTNHARLV